jgi:hypothetical protein
VIRERKRERERERVVLLWSCIEVQDWGAPTVKGAMVIDPAFHGKKPVPSPESCSRNKAPSLWLV